MFSIEHTVCPELHNIFKACAATIERCQLPVNFPAFYLLYINIYSWCYCSALQKLHSCWSTCTNFTMAFEYINRSARHDLLQNLNCTYNFLGCRDQSRYAPSHFKQRMVHFWQTNWNLMGISVLLSSKFLQNDQCELVHMMCSSCAVLQRHVSKMMCVTNLTLNMNSN